MKSRFGVPILVLAAFGSACDGVAAPEAGQIESSPDPALAHASTPTSAAGTFTQTAIRSLAVRVAGRNTILEQASEGSISGTLTGNFDDRLKVVIHPNGTFTAHFTITCECSVGGREGVLEIVAGDRGRLVGPDLATFAGRAVINGATGELAGLRGVLRIEGTVDIPSGLSSYTYSGEIH